MIHCIGAPTTKALIGTRNHSTSIRSRGACHEKGRNIDDIITLQLYVRRTLRYNMYSTVLFLIYRVCNSAQLQGGERKGKKERKKSRKPRRRRHLHGSFFKPHPFYDSPWWNFVTDEGYLVSPGFLLWRGLPFITDRIFPGSQLQKPSETGKFGDQAESGCCLESSIQCSIQ